MACSISITRHTFKSSSASADDGGKKERKNRKQNKEFAAFISIITRNNKNWDCQINHLASETKKQITERKKRQEKRFKWKQERLISN